MSKHTPGPWRVVVEDGVISVRWSVGYVVDDIACGEDDEPKSMGDAHLIAAAPDMLEALEAVENASVRWSPSMPCAFHHACTLARNAIKKARGTP